MASTPYKQEFRFGSTRTGLKTHLDENHVHACVDCTLLMPLSGIPFLTCESEPCQYSWSIYTSPVTATTKFRRGSVPVLSILLISWTAVNPSLRGDKGRR